MKHKTHHLYYLYYPRGWIIIALLLFIATAKAQEQTPPEEFPISTPVFDTLISNPDLFNSFKATGFNTIWQRADNTTKNLLKNYDLLAVNAFSKMEYIYHYTTGYYSKWEAEKNVESNRVGFKHQVGQPAYWQDTVLCWSTRGLRAPACSLMYGPHYRQETRYKRWHYDQANQKNVMYIPRFNMALSNTYSVADSEDVCIIKVVYRYVKENSPTSREHIDTVFMQRTLKVVDFDENGKFTMIKFNDPHDWYKYPPQFILPEKIDNMVGPQPDEYPRYIDWEEYTGIQFCVDWLREDTLCTLYIDYVDVYDNNGWHEFIDNPDSVAYKLKTYAQGFSDWHNIKYWLGTNEPYTIDAYTPIHIVDSLIRSVGAPPLVVHFDPSWWHTFNINAEDEIEMFNKIAKREELPIGFLPSDLNFIRSYSFKSLKSRIYFEMK